MHEIAQALGTSTTKLWNTSKVDNLSTEEQALFRAYKNLHKDNQHKPLENIGESRKKTKVPWIPQSRPPSSTRYSTKPHCHAEIQDQISMF